MWPSLAPANADVAGEVRPLRLALLAAKAAAILSPDLGTGRGAAVRRAIDGGRLRDELMKRALDQGAFAALAGVSPQTVSAACRGKAVNPTTFSKMVAALLRIEIIRGADELGLLVTTVAQNKTTTQPAGGRRGGARGTSTRPPS